MTGSLIAKQIGPDAYRTIFCQIEGHLESQGDRLVKHFDTPEKVDELLSLGDLYVLYPQLTPDPARKHSMDDRQQNVTVAYQRDWGETDMAAQIHTLEELDSPDGMIEFVYIFGLDHQWKYFQGGYLEEGLRDVNADLQALDQGIDVLKGPPIDFLDICPHEYMAEQTM